MVRALFFRIPRFARLFVEGCDPRRREPLPAFRGGNVPDVLSTFEDDEDGHQTTGARGAARDVADGARVENA